jgi:uncharacterized protein with HEPN domain
MLARRFIEGMSVEVFAGDERTLYAVTRCLEIISEASRSLPDDMKARYPEVPWTRIAGAGKVYRHDYEDVLAISCGILFETNWLDLSEPSSESEILILGDISETSRANCVSPHPQLAWAVGAATG